MASSNSWKLKALIKKNIYILKRNIVSTLCEILFPIFLLLIIVGIRSAFKINYYDFDSVEGNLDNFIKNKSVANINFNNTEIDSNNLWNGLSILPQLSICAGNERRPYIATIGIPSEIKETIISDSLIFKDIINFEVTNENFKDFNSIQDLNTYIQDPKYGQQSDYPLICFGMHLENNGNNYNYSLHYFDSSSNNGVSDLPTAKTGLFDRFQSGPDISSFNKYKTSGYTYIMKIINEYILKKVTKNENAKINFGLVAMKYSDYREDPFSSFVGYIIPFFTLIGYMSPLCLYVYRMVDEKENKSKEGMKIMGLTEGIYFLSYFLQYLVISLIDSLINTIMISNVFTKIPLYILFLLFFLWAMDVFALAFFFQSFIDKTRVALILSLLLYFIMYFLSMACMSETSPKVLKIVLSIFPPVCYELGVVLLGSFVGHFRKFHISDYFEIYTNYSIGIMNIMQIFDFLFYLFLGYYLQNVLPHDFGIQRPWYFLFTKEYWCGNNTNNNNNINKNNNNKDSNLRILDKYGNNSPMNNLNNNEYNKYFEGEDLYKDKTQKDDLLQIINISKLFGDGKKAVDNVSLNFYKDEIFALLGHNGAGKTTLISMLTGLYQATSGSAYYDGYNILESNNMDKFRSILGICPQHDILFKDLTIKEHLEMFCVFKGFDPNKINSEVEKVINDFEFENIQNIIAKNLSAGECRKLSIAISLIGGSQVIFLDEPSSGMDVTSRRNLWEILKRQSERKIIILTTHYMEEARVLGNRIGIINEGKMKSIGTPLFLIENHGKYMNLNIVKDENAINDDIVKFIKGRTKNVKCEILSEEIMFRIPKSNYSNEKLTLSNNNSKVSKSSSLNNSNSIASVGNLSLSEFFEELENNLKNLKIKSYTVSMPTLEDVFLNIATSDNSKNKNKSNDDNNQFIDVDNDKILFDTNFKEDFSKKSKFANDFMACFDKRILLTKRDLKGFLMEILCPILLCVVGLALTKVDIFRKNDPLTLSMSEIGKQKILYGSIDETTNDIKNYYFNDMTNITCENLDYGQFTKDQKKIAIENFINKIYDVSINSEDRKDHEVDMTHKDYTGYYAGFLLFENNKNEYEFVEVLNARVMHSPAIYTYFFLKKIIENASDGNVNIDYLHYPMPMTAELKQQKDQMNNSIVMFFVAIAFSLIPANFITTIVRERIFNAKHLMRISGINIFTYWLVNFIFELAKYYFTCGICLLLLELFNFYKDYLYILYLCYGPPMIILTYLLSFLFDTESAAQNTIILLNFLLGALGGVVVLTFRSLDNVRNIGHFLQYIFSLLPSFCFNFGYDLLLNKSALYISEYKDEYVSLILNKKAIIQKFSLVLGLIYYLILEFIIYTIILIIIECRSYSTKKAPNKKLESNVNDSIVLKEIDLVNQENTKKFAVKITNLQKKYNLGNVCNSNYIYAIKNINFSVEKGECFGLLGLNGAGKTTTFKCITKEIFPSNGNIFINGENINNNSFNELSSLFGYCPQFDAIFEYMTVYENLNFYSKIKGIQKNYLDKVIDAMIQEMSLTNYKNKIAGRLSGGNKRKLSVAISFLCNPSIVLLDEPSTGMDPEARRFMWSVIHKISTKGKKSSVIMTTHSMDEAETLCKRMAIMVNGEFVCLGTATELKEKYGYGYEIEVRIMPMNENQISEVLKKAGINKDLKVDIENLQVILHKINKQQFMSELKENRLGSKIIRDIDIKKEIPVISVINWVFFVENALRFIRRASEYFDSIILSEHIENNFLFKIKKGNKIKSIGFLFCLFESVKTDCFVSEYSIQPTSLEQIFNKFVVNQNKISVGSKNVVQNNKNNNSNKKEQEIRIDNRTFELVL